MSVDNREASAGPMVYETHIHTPLCHHADGEPEEYAAAAEQRGMKGIIITCHNPLPDGHSSGVRMVREEFPHYCVSVERAREAFAGRVDVRLGLECDYVPGMEAYLEEQVRWASFDYLLGSVHPHLSEYQQAFWRGDAVGFHQIYFAHLAMAAELGIFDCLAHPDIVKNAMPEEWDIGRILPTVCKALDRIAAAGCAMELNTSGLGKEIPEMNPGPPILREMCLRGIPVVVGSDAHKPRRVGDGFEEAYDLLEEAGYGSVSYYLGRQRFDVAISDARRSISALPGSPPPGHTAPRGVRGRRPRSSRQSSR
jgi:histidinol-phosphatase (PHP family)